MKQLKIEFPKEKTFQEVLDNNPSWNTNSHDLQNNMSAHQGWICPVCGSGVSPFTDKCPCVSAFKKQITIFGPSVANNNPNENLPHPIGQGLK